MVTKFFSQFTDEQMKAQYRANLAGLITLRDKAKFTGKKVNGYTLYQLNEIVKKYTELSK